MRSGEIFIVDDNPSNVNLLAGLLREHGYAVRMANNGKRAISAITAEPPELILLDVLMPEMDGYEVCYRLKVGEATRDIPVIFLSALDDCVDKVKAFKVGGVDYVTKPFEPAEVLVRVECQLTLVRLRNELVRKNRELENANRLLGRATRTLQELTYLDALTEISNRRFFEQSLDREWRRAVREREPIALVMVDVDLFKQYNDRYGHAEGDVCLRRVAEALVASLKRAGDLASRYGGEEFAIVLPSVDVSGALAVAEEARRRVEQLGVEHDRSPYGVVTVSLGLDVASPVDGSHWTPTLAGADAALYVSKEAGRNRVTVHAAPRQGRASEGD